MHPDPAFRVEDRVAIRRFVDAHPFGTLVAWTADGPHAAQLPVIWQDEAVLGLHLSRRNLLADHLDGATVLFVAAGPHHYVSPDWYGLDADQVPTWNYASVELVGVARRMETAALVDQVDRLVATAEASLAPKRAWTRAGMDPRRFDAMMGGIVGFEVAVREWRATLKMNQNKPEAARLRVADRLDQAGGADTAVMMRALAL